MGHLGPTSNSGEDKKDTGEAGHGSEKLAEMEANYPYFRQFVYDKMREFFNETLPELPDIDLPTLAKQEGAEPLEAFIDQIGSNGQDLSDGK